MRHGIPTIPRTVALVLAAFAVSFPLLDVLIEALNDHAAAPAYRWTLHGHVPEPPMPLKLDTSTLGLAGTAVAGPPPPSAPWNTRGAA
jgi:hypothetical protein